MADPRTWSDPEHGFAIDVPSTAPSGATVAVDHEMTAGAAHRLHAHTPDATEVYVDVVSYPAIIDHGVAREDQRRGLAERDPAGTIVAAPDGSLFGRATTRLDFDGMLGGLPRRRRFVWLDLGPRTLRIVCEPTSAANAAIIATLRPIEPATS